MLSVGCNKDICQREVTYIKGIPIYQDLDALRIPVVNRAPIEITQPGRIFVSGHLLFVSEEDLGIHVIDNQDPTAPQPINFIPVPGNNELVVLDNDRLLVDSYYDILVLDVSDPRQVKELSRNEAVFPMPERNVEGHVLTGFDFVQVTEKVDCRSLFFDDQVYYFDHNDQVIAPTAVPTAFSGASSSDGQKISGALSRMTAVDDHLYVINGTSVRTFELQGDDVLPVGEQYAGFNIETIIAQEDHLFMGSANSMSIFDISNPAQPTWVSEFWHPTACDPVYPSGDVAYVTLRSGNTCEGEVDELLVISISNIFQPQLVRSIPMREPYGLTLSKDRLVVCEGASGMVVFDVSDRQAPVQIAEDRSFTAYDVIEHPEMPGVMLVVGPDGLHQYHLSETYDFDELSVIGF
jgi:hypothetical protein